MKEKIADIIYHLNVETEECDIIANKILEEIRKEINKLDCELYQDTYEAGFEDAKELMLELLN